MLLCQTAVCCPYGCNPHEIFAKNCNNFHGVNSIKLCISRVHRQKEKDFKFFLEVLFVIAHRFCCPCALLYALTLVISENYYTTLGFDLKAEETIYTVKMTDESKNDVLEERLQGMLEAYPDYAFESRVQELADELQIQQSLRMIIYLFTGILTCIGLANIFASDDSLLNTLDAYVHTFR